MNHAHPDFQQKVVERYWLSKLKGVRTQPLFIPRDSLAPLHQSDPVALSTPADLPAALNTLAQQQPLGKFILMLAALQITITRYTAQEDLVVCSSALDGTGTVPAPICFFRATVEREQPGSDLVQQVQQDVLQTRRHPGLDLEKLLARFSALQLGDEEALFQWGLLYSRLHAPADQLPAARVLFRFVEQGPDLTLLVENRGDLRHAAHLILFARQYIHILGQLVAGPRTAIRQLRWLPWQPADPPAGAGTPAVDLQSTVIDLLEKRVEESAHAPAMVLAGRTWTYAELNERANRLAHYLLSVHQLKRGELVGLALERSEWVVIGIIGVLKAGGAYVPIDPAYPAERIKYMLQDSACRVLLTDPAWQSPPGIRTGITEDITRAGSDLAGNPPRLFSNADPVYVMYTSGSTGRPKGVVQTHLCLSNLIQWQTGCGAFEEGLKVLQWSSISFDASIHEIFFALLSGGTLCLITDELRRNLRDLWTFILDNGIEVFWQSASALNAIFEVTEPERAGGHPVKHIVSTAEQLKLGNGLRQYLVSHPQVTLHNFYGPTESHVITAHTLRGVDDDTPVYQPIGRPIANARVYLLNPYLEPVPPGVTGDLYLAGACLALGYLNHPEMTAERFVADPFGPPGALMYQSGDKGRWLPDGALEYLGRLDDQVKIRGYRVELGEVESVLLTHPQVREAIVLFSKDKDEVDFLIAYVVLHGACSMQTLEAYVSKALPDYMVPACFVPIKSMPLTPSGKVDKKALPRPQLRGSENGQQYIGPRNAIEETLAAIWHQVLKVDRIGARDHFFKSGGHSLKALRVVAAVYRQLHVNLTLKDIFNHPTLEALADRIASLRPEAFAGIAPVRERAHYPLSSAQKRLWVLQQIEPDSPAYHLPAAYFLRGTLDVNRLEEAFRVVIRRHEILRTRFVLVDGEPMQQIVDADRQAAFFELMLADGENLPPSPSHIRELVAAEAQKPFDLQAGPLLRGKIIRLQENEYLCIVTLHHIISDDWSLEIMTREVLTVYQARSAGTGPGLPPLKIQYKDYAAWEQEQTRSAWFARSRSYWLEHLKGSVPVLELATDHPRPVTKTYRGEVIRFPLDSPLKNGLLRVSQLHDASLFMGLLATVKALLYRYTGQEEIVTGSPATGRTHPDLEDQIGFYVNMLALKTAFSGQDSFIVLLQRVKAVTLSAYEHQLYPFDVLVEELGLGQGMSHSPLFDVMVQLLHEDAGIAALGLEGVSVQACELALDISKFDLTWTFLENKEGALSGSIEYNTDLFKRESIHRMVDHYLQLLRSIVDRPDAPLYSHALLTAGERNQLLREFNRTETPYPAGRPISSLFEEQASRTPDHVAVIFEYKKITYRALNASANQLAHYLREEYRIEPGHLVGIMMNRSDQLVVSLLAILKAGAAYVPIDPNYPQARIRLMLENSGLRGVITDAQYEDRVEGGKVISPARLAGDIARRSTANPENRVQPEDLFYVIYTSGSTGVPKGVMVKQGSVTNLIHWYSNLLNLTERDAVLLMAPVSFDLTQKNFFAPLIKGASLCLSEKLHLDYSLLAQTIEDHNITIINAAPSAFYPLLDKDTNAGYRKLKSLEKVVLGGEPINTRELVKWSESAFYQAGIINSYGPTECTDVVSYYQAGPRELAGLTRIPIGKPIDNTQLYVLDAHRNPVPAGVAGEIYVGGVGVSRGYLNNDELSAQQFVQNPFEAGGVLYRTGDLGKWLPDGNLDFLGRQDDQVKIRGFRIELGEIESRLAGHEHVKESAVTVREKDSDQFLVGYYVAEAAIEASALRSFLEEQLPDYMVPAFFVHLEKLPLTPSGKLDRRALPEPEADAREEYVAPATPTEEKLIRVWAEVLQTEAALISMNKSFFELGGHSLKATRLVSRIFQDMGVSIEIRTVFTHPTPARLARFIAEAPLAAYHRIEPLGRQPHYDLSHAQKCLWILDQYHPGQVAYNIPEAYLFEGRLNRDALEHSLQRLVQRHESLRTTFGQVASTPKQFVADYHPRRLKLAYLDLRELPDPDAEARRLAEAEAITPFHLQDGPLLRVKLLQLADRRYVFLFTIHHIVCDGWSMEVLIDELLTLYNGYCRGVENPLPALRIQYKDYCDWHNRQLGDEKVRVHQQYWRDQFGDELPVLALPFDYPRPAVKTYRGDHVPFVIPASLTAELYQISKQQGASLFMTLLSAVKSLLFHYSGQTDIIVGSPIAGRLHADLELQVGLYLNTLALRTRFSRDETFTSLLHKSKATTLEAYKHQVYPFDRALDDLRLKQDPSRSPLFDVLIVLQNTPFRNGAENALEGLQVSAWDLAYRISKFDLTFNVKEEGGMILGEIEYNTDLFAAPTIDQLIADFLALTQLLVRQPGVPIHSHVLPGGSGPPDFVSAGSFTGSLEELE